MGEIFTPYGSSARVHDPRAISALQKVRSIEELLLAWVSEKRSISLTPVAWRHAPENLNQAGALESEAEIGLANTALANAGSVSAIDVLCSRAGRRIGGGALRLDYLLCFLPSLPALMNALNETGAPREEWFDNRNAALGIELDPNYDLNRCPARSLAQVILSYLVHRDGLCTVEPFTAKPFGGETGAHSTAQLNAVQLKVELVYLNSTESGLAGRSAQSGVGWKETFLVHRAALESFVPHVYWV